MGLVPILKICSTVQTCCMSPVWHLRHGVPALIPYYAKLSHCLMLTWGCTATLPHYDAMSPCGDTALWCDFFVGTLNIFLNTCVWNLNLSEKNLTTRNTHWEQKGRYINFSFPLVSTFPTLVSLLDTPYNDGTTAVEDSALWWRNVL